MYSSFLVEKKQILELAHNWKFSYVISHSISHASVSLNRTFQQIFLISGGKKKQIYLISISHLIKL